MGIFEIDGNFEIPNNLDFGYLESLPVRQHVYGQEIEETPTQLYWLEYQPMQIGDGTISFLRFLNIEMPDISRHVFEYIKKFFPKLEISIDRIGLLKTVGRIRSHIDESNRMCCINIGVKNSTGAITKVSDTQDIRLYNRIATEHRCLDGHSYLLNTNNRHEVISLNYEPRYLFTYGFAIPYGQVLSYYKS